MSMMLLLHQDEVDAMKDAAYRRGAADAIRIADDACFPTTPTNLPSRTARSKVDPDEMLARLRAAAGRVERGASRPGGRICLRKLLGVRDG
jgi:hypothetical protein